MTDPRAELVGAGYDVIAEAFVEWRDRIVGDQRPRWAASSSSGFPASARARARLRRGVPDTRILAERFRVTGVDISLEQINELARTCPAAVFLQADFTALEPRPASFDAVAAFYSFNHVPRDAAGAASAASTPGSSPAGCS